jgi:hypothetical protein
MEANFTVVFYFGKLLKADEIFARMRLFFEDKIHSEYQKYKTDEVIEPEGVIFEYCQ